MTPSLRQVYPVALVATTLKVAGVPAATVWLWGWVRMTGNAGAIPAVDSGTRDALEEVAYDHVIGPELVLTKLGKLRTELVAPGRTKPFLIQR